MNCFSLAGAALGAVLVLASGCDGDARPFSEAVEVRNLNLTSLEVMPPANSVDDIYLNVGEQIQLSVNGVNAAGESIALAADGRDWNVSNSSAASINSDGLLTAKANGAVNVSLGLGGLVSSAFGLTVSSATLVAVQGIIGKADGLERCQTEDYYATGTFSDGTTRNLNNVTWSVSDTTGTDLLVRKNPDSTATVTGMNVGNHVLTASQGGFSLPFALTVADTLNSLRLTPSPAGVDVDDTLNMVALGTYSTDPTSTTERDITNNVDWRLVSNNGALSVDNTLGSRGVVTGLEEGTDTVAVKCGTLEISQVVLVSDTSSGTDTSVLSFDESSPLTIYLVSNSGGVQLNVSTGSSYDEDYDVTDEVDWTIASIGSTDLAATIDDDGIIYPRIAGGEVLVTATSSTGATSTLRVVVLGS